MTRLRTLVVSASGLVLVATSLHAQDLSRYRDFVLGSTVAAVAKTSGAAPADVKTIHQRPSVVQELRWRPQRYGGNAVQTDPVREVAFSFYNDQLFLIVVEYDRQRTEGLTDTDLIESMTASYGPPVLTSTNRSTGARQAEPNDDVVVAQWASAESSLTLLRMTYPASLRLVVTLTAVDALARTVSAEAIRLDQKEAPQRELDRQKQATETLRLAGEKARVVNKPGFKP